MDYGTFVKLVDGGETHSVDFKIICNAFNGSNRDNAELAKDIIAMANNGNVASRIVVGVSDDRTNFRSVDNEKLTDENLQRLCRDTISPMPKVRLRSHSWDGTRVDAKHSGKKFVVIQIGPQARQCFRFNKDYIDWADRYCFRKNEVWIRLGTTSDIASPEQIERLLNGKAAVAPEKPNDNTDYTRLPVQEMGDAILSDLFQLVTAEKGTLYDVREGTYSVVSQEDIVNRYGSGRVIALPTQRRNILMRVVMLIEKTYPLPFLLIGVRAEDGLLIISRKAVSESTLKACDVRLRQDWGWVVRPTHWNVGVGQFVRLPRASRDLNSQWVPFCIVFHKISDTSDLHRAWAGLRNSIREDEAVRKIIGEQVAVNEQCLELWLAEHGSKSPEEGIETQTPNGSVYCRSRVETCEEVMNTLSVMKKSPT
jgi:hypothetical protein